MKSLICIALLLNLIQVLHAEDLTLTLSSLRDEYLLRVNESSPLSLKLNNVPIEYLGDPSQIITKKFRDTTTFTKQIWYAPKKEGEEKVGPFKITLDENVILSNSLQYEIEPKWNGEYKVEYRMDKSEIKAGDAFKLTFESWSEEDQKFSMQPKVSSEYTYKHITNRRESGQTADKVSYHYRKLIWEMTPKHAGTFIIGQDDFENVPTGMIIPDFTITVLPK
ncbi:hypothetical protein P3T73_00850 [Kiritimatiellota bacterium B12222]|nr:hypothetical protein P3T73_00850 [Kiritimatiellota bacterium B12222]